MSSNAEDIHVMPAPSTPGTGANGLLQEIAAFRADCERRYNFNNRWDIVLTVVGILLSIAVVAAGFIKRPEVSAVLGAIVGAVVTAQKPQARVQRSPAIMKVAVPLLQHSQWLGHLALSHTVWSLSSSSRARV